MDTRGGRALPHDNSESHQASGVYGSRHTGPIDKKLLKAITRSIEGRSTVCTEDSVRLAPINSSSLRTTNVTISVRDLAMRSYGMHSVGCSQPRTT